MEKYRGELTRFFLKAVAAALLLVWVCLIWARMDNREPVKNQREHIGTYHCLECGSVMELYVNGEE